VTREGGHTSNRHDQSTISRPRPTSSQFRASAAHHRSRRPRSSLLQAEHSQRVVRLRAYWGTFRPLSHYRQPRVHLDSRILLRSPITLIPLPDRLIMNKCAAPSTQSINQRSETSCHVSVNIREYLPTGTKHRNIQVLASHRGLSHAVHCFPHLHVR
jgi:hypothetical protein